MITPDLDTKDITDGYELVKSKIKFIKYKNHSIAVRNNKLSNLKVPRWSAATKRKRREH